ncbi:CGNR zinc finger domain-containing protein [Leifsonia sp. F6_8S_P_1B]|uniref:CGNR zinc finger domain-containing protein n=1 Tax=Leifsonia williamsii TaxID=3035919 RepID=A0ABT8K698_9MICO|nr:CGNR zinc finger domain-containing protein [Leifsonia williamsii]MDN4612983.1 CGNR zinc finger domain-containing protein [Leifsonia williamsii]
MASFTLLGEPLAIDLVNTLKTAHTPALDQLDADGAVEAFWAFEATRGTAQGEPPLAPLEAEETRGLRALAGRMLAAIRAGEAPDAADLAEANRLLAAAPTRVELVAGDTGLAARTPSPADGTVDGTRAAVLRSLLDAADAARAGRLRACAADDCDQLFVATNAKRRWCTPEGCGNRARVARFAARARVSA